MAGKIVVLEEITRRSWFLVKLYSFCGFQVCYLRATKGCQHKRWIGVYKKEGWLLSFERGLQFDLSDGFYTDKAFENIEPVYRAIKSCSVWIERIIRLYGNRHIELAFKKKLVSELSRFYYLNTLFEEVVLRFKRSTVFFIPGNGNYFERMYFDALASYQRLNALVKENAPASLKDTVVEFPFWLKMYSFIHDLALRLCFLGKTLAMA